MSTVQFDLSGRVAIVTGDGRGIGRAIADALALAGADVGPTARTREDGETAASAIRSHGSESLEVTTDVAAQRGVENLFKQTNGELGGVDVVANNTEINPESALGPFESI